MRCTWLGSHDKRRAQTCVVLDYGPVSRTTKQNWQCTPLYRCLGCDLGVAARGNSNDRQPERCAHFRWDQGR